jgi:hypothetical protein
LLKQGGDREAQRPKPAERHRPQRGTRRGDGRGHRDVAGREIVAAITRSSAERLGLAQGQPVTVFIKATEVILGVE